MKNISEDTDQLKVNDRLIATAPELLDVLQQIVSDKHVEKLGSLKLRADRAIAKATGGTHD